MKNTLISTHSGVTLMGGGPVLRPLAQDALRLAPHLVAADGGADRAIKLGLLPEAVIGDLDSLSRAARVALQDRLHRVSEQETTDFDKALRHISAPFVLALGFSGGRADHELAVYNALMRHPNRVCVILSGSDVIFLAPPRLELELPLKTRFSLFPMGEVSVESQGLRWPTNGLRFSPDGAIGTSNQTRAARVTLETSAAKMLVILPRAVLAPVLQALVPGFAAPTPAPGE